MFTSPFGSYTRDFSEIDNLSESYARQRLSQSPLAAISQTHLVDSPATSQIPPNLPDSPPDLPPHHLKYVQATLGELFFYFRLNNPEVTLYDLCASVSQEIGFIKVLGNNYLKDLIAVGDTGPCH